MIPAGVRIFVVTEPVDMRQGFDRLAQAARDRIGQDPQQGGALVVFLGRRARRLKILWFERNSACMLYKRLHGAVFELPVGEGCGTSVRIDAPALARLLAGVPCAERAQRRK